MPRIFRILPETGIFHILTRGNNRQAVFQDNNDYQKYLKLVGQYKKEHHFFLYHYCLIPNHVHIILETTLETNLAKLMKQLNLRYMYHYKRRYSYDGHLWQGRFKSLLIDRDEYLIACGRYIELNPVRAGIVENPMKYKWSSYNYYAYGEKNFLVDRDPLYNGLGKDEIERQIEYRKGFVVRLKEINLNARFLGNEVFIRKMEKEFNINNLKAMGRPRKIEKVEASPFS